MKRSGRLRGALLTLLLFLGVVLGLVIRDARVLPLARAGSPFTLIIANIATTSLSASSFTTIYTPTSGKRARIYVCHLTDGTSEGVQFYKGSTALWTQAGLANTPSEATFTYSPPGCSDQPGADLGGADVLLRAKAAGTVSGYLILTEE